MAVYEIRDSTPVSHTEKPKPRKRQIDPVAPITRVRAIGRLAMALGREQEKEQRQPRKKADLSPEALRAVRIMLERLNQDLETAGCLLHLILRKDEDGWALDLYDLSDPTVCNLVGDVQIDIEDLPVLIANLQREAGILLDCTL